MKYFVWIAGLKGPEAQIWHGEPVDGAGKKKACLFIKELEPYEENLNIYDLEKIYPYVEKKE